MDPQKAGRPLPPSVAKVGRHAAYADLTHDDVARLNFVQMAFYHVATNVFPGNAAVWENRVGPKFVRDRNRPPKTPQEVGRVMRRDPYWQMWSSLKRNNQEMMYDVRGGIVARQHETLKSRARAQWGGPGSLRLDPSLKVPAYVNAVDIHLMPGGYDGEMEKGDAFAGAIYDTGSLFVSTGGMLGPWNDGAGWAMVAFLQRQYGNIKPRRILDLGCTVGHGTLPLAQAFPDAKMFAIDVAAPVLRYAHARANALGVPIQFSQQDAEATNFPDGYFDVVTSAMFLHEVPQKPMRRVIKEVHRVLRPGGVMLHNEQPQYHGQPPYDHFIREWDTWYNNEPFRCAFRSMDLDKLAVEAGFPADSVVKTMAPGARKAASGIETVSGGAWFMYAARKAV